MSFMQDNKWHLPGWRIEQKYTNKVLIGNWNEERRKFQRGTVKSGSTHSTDFRPYHNFAPDITSRRSAMLKCNGLDKKFLFTSDGKTFSNYSNNLISWYDQQFNGRETAEPTAPPTRTWDRQTLAWLPEKSDHPLTGPPTNFGLLAEKKKKWQRELELNNFGDYVSTYSMCFRQHPSESLVVNHFATPKPLSSHFHPHKINKDLPLRNNRLHTAAEYQPASVPMVV